MSAKLGRQADMKHDKGHRLASAGRHKQHITKPMSCRIRLDSHRQKGYHGDGGGGEHGKGRPVSNHNKQQWRRFQAGRASAMKRDGNTAQCNVGGC